MIHQAPEPALERDGSAEIERQRAKFERQNAELSCQREELRQYARVASHDLQEPLRAIVSCGQLLRQEFAGSGIDETARQLLDHMIEGGERMQQLVLGLLQYSRIGAGAPRRVPLSSRAALDQALRQLEPEIEETGARIDASDLPSVACDPQEIVQLFQNLLENAIKYRGAARPEVRILARRDAEHVHFSVADNGIGIEPQFFERIFVLFQRLHARGKYPGSGIGLSVCKKIVERHGGKIWVESSGDQGATFHFTLPCPASSPGDES